MPPEAKRGQSSLFSSFKLSPTLTFFFRWKLEGSYTVQNWTSEGQFQSRGHPTGRIRIEGSWFCPFKGNFRWPCVPVLTTEKVCWDAHVLSQLSFIIAESWVGGRGFSVTVNSSFNMKASSGLGWGSIWNLTLGITPPMSSQRQNFSTSQDHSNSKFCFKVLSDSALDNTY